MQLLKSSMWLLAITAVSTATLEAQQTCDPVNCGVATGNRNCSNTYMSQFTALTDMPEAQRSYQGFTGGLYPNESNEIPAVHAVEGWDNALTQIMPLDSNGNVDLANGKIVMASLGLSNTARKFCEFIPMAAADPAVNTKLVLVNGAQGGITVEEWADPNHAAWSNFQSEINLVGANANQLQIVWCELTTNAQNLSQGFPASAEYVQGYLEQTLVNLKSKYPSVKVVYLSARTYGGYGTTVNPEPHAFENGYTVKWLIEKQINGDAALAFSGSSPQVPWLCWGPYFWTNGLGPDDSPGGVGGRSDGLEYDCNDFCAKDGIHPAIAGRLKVANYMLNWFKSDPLAKLWFLESPNEAAFAVSSGDQTPADTSAQVGSLDTAILQFKISTHAVSDPVDLQSVQLTAQGNGDDTQISKVNLYFDANTDGQVDASDTLLASGNFAQDNAALTLTLQQVQILQPNSTSSYVIAYDFAERIASAGFTFPFLAAMLFPLGLISYRSRKKLLVLTCVVLFLAITGLWSCSSGGGGGSDSPPANVGPTGKYSFTLDSITATSANSGQNAIQVGLPIQSSELTVQ